MYGHQFDESPLWTETSTFEYDSQMLCLTLAVPYLWLGFAFEKTRERPFPKVNPWVEMNLLTIIEAWIWTFDLESIGNKRSFNCTSAKIWPWFYFRFISPLTTTRKGSLAGPAQSNSSTKLRLYNTSDFTKVIHVGYT